MKKKCTGLLAALLLSVLCAGTATAAETLTLPTATVGAAYHYDFAPVAGGQTVSLTGTLPEGLSLYSGYDEASDAGSAYLEGTPTAAGDFSFTVSTDDGGGQSLSSIECTLSVAAAELRAEMPVITEQPVSLSVQAGEGCNLSVAASVSQGSLSYLWYSSSSPDMGTMTAINRGTETGQMLNVPTDTPGVTYYCVMVTNTYNGELASVYSSVVSVTVAEAEPETISRIEIMAAPDKREYRVGETLDTTGMKLRAWTNLGYRDLTEGYLCYPTTLDTPGEQAITVTYGVYAAQFTVTVRAVQAQTPLISAQPQELTVAQGKGCRLSVTASVSDGGTLSYRWYSGPSGDVNKMTPIATARANYLDIDTLWAGSAYYCVQVTNTLEGVEASVYSDCVRVTVQAEVPTVLEQPKSLQVEKDAICKLSCKGYIAGSGSLSYVWYSSSQPDLSTMTAINRGRETAPTLQPDTSQEGVTYYCALVVNTDNGEVSSTYSRVVSVTVGDAAAATPSPSASPSPTPAGAETEGEETPEPTVSPAPEDTAPKEGSSLGAIALIAALGAAAAGGAYWYLRKKQGRDRDKGE